MQLLHSFGDDELARPELYHTLIAYLNHAAALQDEIEFVLPFMRMSGVLLARLK